ncbi:hypothetical protein [Paenibacillus oralis]|uniref:hypothetical protein n=1 Tax=Paenibacillus oralis TaxID=2490856 RepID=UPI001FE66288|nr:hypothetical protein [Paenibacillus oralis]
MGKWDKKFAVLGAAVLGLWLLGGCGSASDSGGSSLSMESASPAADMAVSDQASNEAADSGMGLEKAASADKADAEKSGVAGAAGEAETSGGGSGSSAGAAGEGGSAAAAAAGQTSPRVSGDVSGHRLQQKADIPGQRCDGSGGLCQSAI